MVTLINPNLVVLKRDLFTTGVVYMPFGLAYFAGALEKEGVDFAVIDAFGEAPDTVREKGEFLVRGMDAGAVVERIPEASRVAILYAITMTAHSALLDIADEIKKKRPGITVIVMENPQAVTAYSLETIQDDFYRHGVDYIITGDPERRGTELVRGLKEGREPAAIDGIGRRRGGGFQFTPAAGPLKDLDRLPFAAWDRFPLENYWRLKYGHGPFEAERYLPILSSRGCPYACRFCVTPATNILSWRPRSARNVVDEMEAHYKKFSVREFHFEDLNPTVSDQRMQGLAGEIIRRRLPVIWKLVSGTKIETIKSEETVRLMAQAGCNYISFSPESGSERVLQLMGKTFDRPHALRMLKAMRFSGIKTQACFVIGFPGETDADRELTHALARQLTKEGVDEIAVFIITPVPGSELFEEMNRSNAVHPHPRPLPSRERESPERRRGICGITSKDVTDYSRLNFSPTWRTDYAVLNRFRLRLYRDFLLWKGCFHPVSLLAQPLRFLRRNFKTKMEMVAYRAMMTKLSMQKEGRWLPARIKKS